MAKHIKINFGKSSHNTHGKKTTSHRNKPMREVNENIKITQLQYTNLLAHIADRMALAKLMRDRNVDTFKYIDREYYSWLRLSAADRKRALDNAQGIGVKPTDVKLSMLFSQIDEAQTFILGVLAPEEAIYNVVAPKEKKDVAKGFSVLMNEHAEDFQHYRNYSMFANDCMRYNFGAIGVEWLEEQGNIVELAAGGQRTTKRRVTKSGNALESYDPYNLLMDPSVNPVDLPDKGEYYGYVNVQTPFRLKVMESKGEIFNVEAFLRNQPSEKWREKHPTVRNTDTEAESDYNWVSVLSARSGAVESSKAYETIKGHLWLIPKDWGLSNDEDYQIWKFILGSDDEILFMEHADNAHGILPIAIAMPYEDHFIWQTKGPTERLIPYQQFGSFMMNIHQRSARKALYGLTFYDKHHINFGDADDDEILTGGKVAIDSKGQDIDLRKLIVQFSETPDTQNTIQNIGLVGELGQDILPSRLLQQVAGLERATQFQAAATVQSANKRNLKAAKVIDGQAMVKIRFMQMMNIFEKQDMIEVLTDGGELVKVDPKEFVSAKLRFLIADGLKGLDRLSLILNSREMLNAVLQSKQAGEQLDIVGIIDHLTSMWGDHTDFKQFKLISPVDKLPADQRDLAFRLLQAFAAKQEGGGTGGAGNTGGTPNVPPAV